MTKNNCKILTNYEDTAIHAIFHVLILLIVLTAFFFIIVENLEKRALSNQLVNGIKTGLNKVEVVKNQDLHYKLLRLAQIYKKSRRSKYSV